MDKVKIEHHIQHLEEKHKELEHDLTEAKLHYDDILASKLKKEKLKLKDEIEKFKRQIAV
jgi:hypothetical protein